MISISRNPESLSNQDFDLVVIGGGIYGVGMLLEASRRGLKTLLIERADFGGATSWNSLRIVHGGLRYLQNLDLVRFRRSVQEQAWWLETFPDLIEPLPCIIPLYNRGLRNVHVMSAALKLNDWLAAPIRNRVLTKQTWPRSRMLDIERTVAEFPQVRQKGLVGGALWHDAKMKSPQRLIIELLRWSCSAGGAALNYMNYESVEQHQGRISAVHARCQVTGRDFRFATKYVVNCGGPWAHGIDLGEATPRRKNDIGWEDCAIAFNLVVRRSPLSQAGLAVCGPSPKAATYFLVPLGNRVMIGTEHLAPQKDPPTPQQIATFLDQINEAVPGIELCESDIAQMLVGRLPAKSAGSKVPINSPIIVHHRKGSDPLNATSVMGPKYTTARKIAETTLRSIIRSLGANFEMDPQFVRPGIDPRVDRFTDIAETLENGLAQDLRQWMLDESVVFIDDFILRRIDVDVEGQIRLRKLLAQKLDWPTPAALTISGRR